MIIIWTNLVGPSLPQCYIPSPKVIGLLVLEKIFKGFLPPYMGMAAILVMWPVTIWTNYCSRVLRSLHMKFEFNWPSGFRGEDVWNCEWTDDGCQSDWYTISSTMSLRLRWTNELTLCRPKLSLRPTKQKHDKLPSMQRVKDLFFIEFAH